MWGNSTDKDIKVSVNLTHVFIPLFNQLLIKQTLSISYAQTLFSVSGTSYEQN